MARENDDNYQGITANDIEEMIGHFDSIKSNEKPFIAWFKCEERGLIQVDLKKFNLCDNKNCVPCSHFKKLLNSEIEKQTKEICRKKFNK